MAAVLIHPWFCPCGGQQQRPLLCHRSALPNAPLRHHLHRVVQVEDEQVSGLHHVPAVLHFPGAERHAGGPHHHLPRVHLKRPTPVLGFRTRPPATGQ